MMLVHGKAIIIPTTPIRAPQIDRDRRMIAGFKPVIFPITFGTMMPSWIICTMQNTSNAQNKIHQKFCPVSAAFSRANKIVGANAMSCR